jgi:hypothetical protein
MRYKIEDVEGIGQAYGAKLGKAGISSTDDLLGHCGSAKGRRQVPATSDLDEGRLLKWANVADLMRIRGSASSSPSLAQLRASIPSRSCARGGTSIWPPG